MRSSSGAGGPDTRTGRPSQNERSAAAPEGVGASFRRAGSSDPARHRAGTPAAVAASNEALRRRLAGELAHLEAQLERLDALMERSER